MNKQGIIVKTIYDLEAEFNQSNCNWSGTSDFFPRSGSMDQSDLKPNEIFEEAYKRLLEEEIDAAKFNQILKDNGINLDAAL